MKKLPKINTSELLKAALPYILVGLMATKLGQAYRMASGGDVLDRIFGAFLKIGEAFTNPLPSLHPFDLLVGAACGALLWFIVYQKSKNARKYRRGAEYGTARWGNAKDIEPFIDPDFSQNILLSETERLTLGKISRRCVPRGNPEFHPESARFCPFQKLRFSQEEQTTSLRYYPVPVNRKRQRHSRDFQKNSDIQHAHSFSWQNPTQNRFFRTDGIP